VGEAAVAKDWSKRRADDDRRAQPPETVKPAEPSPSKRESQSPERRGPQASEPPNKTTIRWQRPGQFENRSEAGTERKGRPFSPSGVAPNAEGERSWRTPRRSPFLHPSERVA